MDALGRIAHIRLRLTVLSFLQFGIWGAWLTSVGSYLAQVGLGDRIWLFFATQGFVALFMPALAGILADRFVEPRKMLALCHALAAACMLSAGLYCMKGTPQFGPLYAWFAAHMAFFMPTIGLQYAVSYKALEQCGKDPVQVFPPIRMFGTVGFVCTMLLSNFLTNSQGVQFQHSHEQFLTAGVLGLLLAAYALTLPRDERTGGPVRRTFAEVSGLAAFRLFKKKEMAVFFAFCALIGCALQITNGYANPFISSFRSHPVYAGTWGANNANALISISQISEAFCILLIPWAMKRFRIKGVILIALVAWVLRFGLFGLGNPGGGVWMFVLSCIVYGVAFDFFNISASLFVNARREPGMHSSAQGLFMLMTNGIGATVGTFAAGRVVNRLVYHAAQPSWSTAWFIFAAYAAVVAVAFLVFFRERKD